MNPLQSTSIGYCTNVYPGTSLQAICANLRRYAQGPATALRGLGPTSVGLWLSESVVAELGDPGNFESLQQHLRELRLRPQTINGFPQGDFHQAVVKHGVYLPDWTQSQRLEYTQQLASLQARLLGPGCQGTISTVPIAWGKPPFDESQWKAAIANLSLFIRHAAELEDSSGTRIRLCFEAEPGCLLSTGNDLLRFLQDRLARQIEDEALARRYLAVCHDVCHAAVMFEEQLDVLRSFDRAGWDVAKVQISSALVADFGVARDVERQRMLTALRRYAEPRYLHQTCLEGGILFDDLPAALDRADQNKAWRIHFHVPIFQAELESGLTTTQNEIRNCISALQSQAETIHWEVETYAWNVLPDPPTPAQLDQFMARELNWLQHEWDAVAAD